MNSTSYNLILKNAAWLATDAAGLARGRLLRPLELALGLIEALRQIDSGQWVYIDELVEGSGLPEPTVRQILLALENGSYPGLETGVDENMHSQKIVRLI